ncbi:MAG: cyclase family protein [Alphaproteobacteria bacterium]
MRPHQMAIAAISLGTALIFSAPAFADECSRQNWKACKGKPWVIGDTMETPIGDKWWPHPIWGEGDTAGSTNWYTKPEVVLRGLAEADRGKVYSLGRQYDAEMPLFGTRSFAMMIPHRRGPFGANMLLSHQEFVATNIGQVGTQFDGLAHIGVQIGEDHDESRMRFYNGFTEQDIVAEGGIRKLGVENLHPIVGRGIMIDVAAAKGTDMLDRGYEITMADVREALDKQGMADFTFENGDGVFFRTGWGQLWKKDNARFNSGAPGIGMEVALWLTDEVKVGVVGADTWPTEVVPNPDPACRFCVHQHLIVRHGIVNQENMDLDGLSEDRVYRFLYAYSPTPIAGATGSMGAPIAID